MKPLFDAPNWWHRLATRLLVSVITQMNDPRGWAVKTTDHFIGSALQGAPRFAELLVAALDTLPDGTTELMVHPGHVDGPLPGDDTYTTQREVELAALTSPDVVGRLHAGRIRLIHFGDL